MEIAMMLEDWVNDMLVLNFRHYRHCCWHRDTVPFPLISLLPLLPWGHTHGAAAAAGVVVVDADPVWSESKDHVKVH